MHQLAGLLLRRARQNRIAVKVDERHRAAALHHAMRGDRRIDAAGEQARHAAGRSGRQASRRRVPCRRSRTPDRSAARRESSRSGSSRLTRPPARLLDAPADLALDLRRGHRKALVRAARRHAKAVARAIAEVARGSRSTIASRSQRRPAVARARRTRSSRCRRCGGCVRRPGLARGTGPSTTSMRPISARTRAHVEIRQRLAAGCAPGGRGTTGGSCP